jgi:hypothetical protein
LVILVTREAVALQIGTGIGKKPGTRKTTAKGGPFLCNNDELPSRKLRGIRKSDENYLRGVTPECFYRGPVPVSPGFPLKACGNDGLRKENEFNAARHGEFEPVRLNKLDLNETTTSPPR